MPRERTTWNRDEVAKRASLSKQADPYTMNQDHKQPAADAYTIGGPSDFAEDVHPSSGTWEAEYSNGQVKRNEIGMPEMRGDTFNHAEKTATEVEMVKKASLAVAVAKAMLPKSASRSLIEEQAGRFMRFADEDLVETYKALVANEQQEGQGEEQEAQKQAQDQQGQAQEDQKQAGQLPPALKEHMKEKGEGKDDDQDKQAGQLPPALKEHMEEKKDKSDDQGQEKQAQMDVQAQVQALASQVQQILAHLQGKPVQAQQDQGEKKDDDKLPAFLKDKEAQEQQQQADQGQEKQAAAERIQAAITAALAAGQDPAAAAMKAAQGCMQQPMADDQLIDQMLAQQQQEPMMSDVGIEMEAPSMDTGDIMMTAQDDALLSQIFANDETEQAQQAQGQKQAHAVRTASTRTVGTRPTQGVSGLGGLSASKGESADLSSMWSSAPDVREAFGINR